jgi:hypothetical protein
MRNLVLSTLALAAACAASNRAVDAAKAARYRGDKLALLQAAEAATADKYKLAMSDETTLRIETTGRWYTPDGLAALERNNDMRDVPDRSIHMRLIVKLVPDRGDWAVAIEPVMMRYFAGRPNPDPLAPDDPSLPGWAMGRVDQLHHAIHEALAGYEVKVPGGVTASPTAAPAAPPPAAPAPRQPAPEPAPQPASAPEPAPPVTP